MTKMNEFVLDCGLKSNLVTKDNIKQGQKVVLPLENEAWCYGRLYFHKNMLFLIKKGFYDSIFSNDQFFREDAQYLHFGEEMPF